MARDISPRESIDSWHKLRRLLDQGRRGLGFQFSQCQRDVFTHIDGDLLAVLEQLHRRESIFHNSEFGHHCRRLWPIHPPARNQLNNFRTRADGLFLIDPN
jgi:hypothetical protein